jgi:hypothetical protein
MMKYQLLFILLLSASAAFAQKTRNQRCATATSPRQVYTPLVSRYVDVEFGVRKAFAYKYDGQLDEHYSFSSSPGPYASVSYNFNFYRRWELYAAGELYINRPGMKFSYGTSTEGFTEKMIPGIVGVRLLAGLSYNVRPGWKLTVAPALIFASNWEYYHTGSVTGFSSGPVAGYRVNWRNQGFYDKVYAGLDLQTEHFIYRHVYFNAGVTVEFDSLTPVEGEVEIALAGGAGTQTYQASAAPYLLNANVGLSFRFWEKGNY